VKRVVESVTSVRINERSFWEALGLVILHHDLGKLTNEYQNKEFFRHEILSSFILYNQLKQDHSKTELLAAIFAAAVYLHHEGLQISHEHFELREPTYSYLINWLSSREFHMVSNWDELFYQINRQYLLLPMRPVSLNQKVIKGLEVANTLGSLLVIVDGFPEPLAMRMAIATVLHPLTICDNRAASVRGGIPSIISKTLAKFFDEGVPTGEEE
jgi:CRISPR-associated endonuclease Cas3-HD